ncbi:MAG: SAM-dependent methyltransferase, partial [Specibacter sp.]
TGGSLLIVGHSASDAAAGARRPDAPGLFFTALGVAAMLEPELWKIEVAESRPRRTKGNDGESITISDEVVRAVRLG